MFAKERRRIQESLKHSNNETTEHDEFETESDSEEKQISSFKRIARSAQPIGKSKTIEPAEREKIARQKQTRESENGSRFRINCFLELNVKRVCTMDLLPSYTFRGYTNSS